MCWFTSVRKYVYILALVLKPLKWCFQKIKRRHKYVIVFSVSETLCLEGRGFVIENMFVVVLDGDYPNWKKKQYLSSMKYWKYLWIFLIRSAYNSPCLIWEALFYTFLLSIWRCVYMYDMYFQKAAKKIKKWIKIKDSFIQ